MTTWATASPFALLTEDGSFLLAEDGSTLTIEYVAQGWTATTPGASPWTPQSATSTIWTPE